jgi:hypothetical protein
VRRLTDAEIDAQIPAARAREAQAFTEGQRAISAWYDAQAERVVLELSNGLALAFPARIVRGLQNATAAQRAQLSLTPSGGGVMWAKLDTDISVPGLIAKSFGSSIVKELGRSGGRSKSDVKAKASKTNGAKGGRPRKKPAHGTP